jgi:deoxycytidylate deaminase
VIHSFWWEVINLKAMKILSDKDRKVAAQWMKRAATVALQSPCFRSQCGSVIVKGDAAIGEGFNGPPAGQTVEQCLKDDLPAKFKSDKTCCVHAEQRAIMDALVKHPDQIKGSRLYFIRLDSEGHMAKAGKPYCTICSKMVLDSGVAEFTLWHDEGICVYDTEEYNQKSFEYRGD